MGWPLVQTTCVTVCFSMYSTATCSKRKNMYKWLFSYLWGIGTRGVRQQLPVCCKISIDGDFPTRRALPTVTWGTLFLLLDRLPSIASAQRCFSTPPLVPRNSLTVHSHTQQQRRTHALVNRLRRQERTQCLHRQLSGHNLPVLSVEVQSQIH